MVPSLGQALHHYIEAVPVQESGEPAATSGCASGPVQKNRHRAARALGKHAGPGRDTSVPNL